jgi:hypothetical protein
LASSEKEADMTQSRQQLPNRRRQILEDETPGGELFNADVYQHVWGHREDVWVTGFIARLTELIRKIGGKSDNDKIGGSDK